MQDPVGRWLWHASALRGALAFLGARKADHPQEVNDLHDSEEAVLGSCVERQYNLILSVSHFKSIFHIRRWICGESRATSEWK